jgi:hypothetical protein
VAQKKTMHVAAEEVARGAELHFCQHAADRALTAAQQQINQAAPLAALAAACGTWADWTKHWAVCTVADGKQQVHRVASMCSLKRRSQSSRLSEETSAGG